MGSVSRFPTNPYQVPRPQQPTKHLFPSPLSLLFGLALACTMFLLSSPSDRSAVAQQLYMSTVTALLTTLVFARGAFADGGGTSSQLYLIDSAQYSPYYSVAPYPSPPLTCTISQVNILQRHGARGPTENSGKSIQRSLAKVVGKASYSRSEMQFLQNYTYGFDTQASLLPFGATESSDAGKKTFDRYCGSYFKRLLCGTPFVRASDSPRVVDSAGNWSQAYTEASGYQTTTQVIFSEEANANNTLVDNCPNLPSSDTEQTSWRSVWTPAVIDRLQSGENYGLNSSDILNLAYLCAFESLKIGLTSPFCGLFLDSEWPSIEYDGDLGKYYDDSWGVDLAASQGVGYVNELLSRLTGDLSYVNNDATQVNHTVDSNPSTFPLGKHIYADFSHDNQLLPIMTLIGLFHDVLAPTRPDPSRAFVVSRIVPFAGRMVVEKMECLKVGWAIFKGPQEYVRILVNDQAMDLTDICGKDFVTNHGTLCNLSAFVSAMTKVVKTATLEFAGCGFVPAP